MHFGWKENWISKKAILRRFRFKCTAYFHLHPKRIDFFLLLQFPTEIVFYFSLHRKHFPTSFCILTQYFAHWSKVYQFRSVRRMQFGFWSNNALTTIIPMQYAIKKNNSALSTNLCVCSITITQSDNTQNDDYSRRSSNSSTIEQTQKMHWKINK